MIIAIDFDETLFPTLEKIVEIYNRRHDKQLSTSQITTYNLYECLDVEIADELLALFVDKNVYNNLQPYKGAVKTIQILVNNGHEVYIATATDVKNFAWKEQLIQRHFPFLPKDNLIRIHNKKLLNIDVMVDDKLDNLVQTFADRICFNQPWNQSASKDFAYGMYRVNHWGEIVNIINEIERKNKEWNR